MAVRRRRACAGTYLAARAPTGHHELMALRRDSVWWQMMSGMRAYGVAITVIWTMCACTVLAVLAVVVPGKWMQVGFGAGAVGELVLSALTLRFLTRASVRGRFDV